MKKTFLISALALSLGVLAQDGSLDTTFDSDGRVLLSVGTFDDSARAMAIQSDGKILVAGHTYGSENYDFILARLKTDGSLDTAFGNNGFVITPVSSGDDHAKTIAIQQDGKMVVVGTSFNGTNDIISIARYLSNGDLDTSFATNGIKLIKEGNDSEYGQSVAIQQDGKIVIAGGIYKNQNYDVRIVRLLSNGSLDTSFDTDGFVQTTLTNYDDFANAIAIQSDGKIIVAGYSNAGLDSNIMLLRYNSNGTLDTAFDNDGKVSTQVWQNTKEYANAIKIDNEGKIIIAGHTENSFYDFVTARYLSNGSLDTSFDIDGVAVIDFGTGTDMGQATAVASQSNGDLIVAGLRDINTKLYFAIAKYKNNGSLDTTFDGDGIVNTYFSSTGNDQAMAVAIQSDGKILAAGASYESQNRIAVARYNNSLAPTVGIDELENQSEFICYHNSNTEILTIKTSQKLADASLSITNLLGQEVFQINSLNGFQNDIKLNKIPQGVYLIKIYGNENSVMFKKIYIQ